MTSLAATNLADIAQRSPTLGRAHAKRALELLVGEPGELQVSS